MRDEAYVALDRLIDAVERALSEKSHDAQTAARDDARHLWIDLTRIVDQGDVLSDAYLEKSYAPGEQTKRARAMDLVAQVMYDLWGAFNGWTATYLGSVAVELHDRLDGRSSTGILDPVKRGRGKRKRSVAVKAAMQEFALLVHYNSRREGVSVEASLESTPSMLSYPTFKDRQTVLTAGDRKTARDLGAAMRKGAPLTAEQQAVAERFDAILSDPEQLKLRANAILGVFDRQA